MKFIQCLYSIQFLYTSKATNSPSHPEELAPEDLRV